MADPPPCRRSSLLDPQKTIEADLIMVHNTPEHVDLMHSAPSAEACSTHTQTHYSVTPIEASMYNIGYAPPTTLLYVGRLSSNRSLKNSSFVTVYNTTPPSPTPAKKKDECSPWCCCCCLSSRPPSA